MRRLLQTLLLASVLMFSMNFSASADLPKLKKSITWEKLKTHPAPLPVLGHITPVPSEIGRDIACIGVQKGGKKIGVLLWYCDEEPNRNLERDLQNITLEGITFQRPVYVDLVTGNVQDLAGCVAKGTNTQDVVKLRRLPLWDAPVLLINRKEIRWE